ncbi:UvrD-helicase domain-containing protein [Streptomyces sp. NPDC088707]|uniref:UvrD-helicase domain-containing protein n=1 Tax=Streptomyces sp. NPDC088707 TaxID=3365871 RepID=UPI0037FFAA6A
MQITNAAERLATSLETKARRPWNPDLHPRDSKGRFIETGGVARLWGGGMARVLRALGGRNVLVQNLATQEQSTIHASRLTMVARPDGTAPTKSKTKVRNEDERRLADGRRGTGSADADDAGDQGDTPDDPHDKDDQGDDIGEDIDGEDHGAGPEPEDDEPEDEPEQKPAAKRQRRDPNRRFKTLNDVRAHWASTKLRPYTQDKKAQASHNELTAGLMDQLDKPQLSRNGHFVVGKMNVRTKKHGVLISGWGVMHAETGVRLTLATRKEEALDFANSLENIEVDGEAIDWNAPDAFERINSPEFLKKAGVLAAEARERFEQRAAKKRDGAASRTKPAPATPDQQNQAAAQRVADRSGVPAANVAVGHIGPKTSGDNRGRPRDSDDLRELWKQGGNDGTPERQRDVLRRFASDPKYKLHLADHRGFAIVEDTTRDDDFRFTVRAAGTGRSLHGLGLRGLHDYGNFADLDTANRFTLFLGSNLRHSDGRTVDWGGPAVDGELLSLRDKDGQRSPAAIWQIAGQFDRNRGANDTAAARFGRRRDELTEEQRQNPETAPETPETGIPGEDMTPQPADGQQRTDQEEQQSERVQAAGEGVLGDVPAQGAGGAGGDDASGDVLRPAERGDRESDRGVPGRLPGGDGAGSGLQGRDEVDQHGDAAGQGEGTARDAVQPGEGARDGGEGDAAGQPAEDRGRVAFGSSDQERTAPQYQPPEDGRSVVPSGVAARVKANIAAIEVLRGLEDENRPATAAEQETLARWSGWGATPQVFVPEPKPEFAPLQRRLRELLSDDEYEAAKDNTLNAHYTDPAIAREMWKAVQELGFDGGNVLEPGSGSGNFIGHAPASADMTGVELDPITAGIAKALYPQANIRNEGFEKTRAADGTFDLTVGNVPFGDYPVVDLRHNKGNHNIHNAFILKSLALTRPGGLVAVVTSRFTMDGNTPRSEDARMEMARKADLVGAVRLPTGAHRRTAGTDVVTDLLIFRRRETDKEFTSGRTRKGDVKPPQDRKQDDPPVWVHSIQVTDLPGQDPDDAEAPKVSVNPYFLDNPRNVIGDMHVGHGMYGPGELRVHVAGDLNEELGHTLKRIVGRAKDARLTYKPDTGERRKVELLPEESDRPDGHVQLESDGTFTQARDGMVHPYEVPKTQIEEARQLVGIRDSLKALVREEARPDADETLIETLRGDLKTRYDAYHQKFGSLNRFDWADRKATDPDTGEQVKKSFRKRPPMGGLLTKDPTMAVVLSLDSYDEPTKTSTPAAIFTKRQARHRTIAERASNPEDAMAIVLEQRGTLDPDALAEVMRVDPQVARERLLAARSVDPETGDEYPLVFEPHDGANLVPAAEYLSGNVRERLTQAQALAADDARFEINVKHLEDVLPEEISPGEIDAPMGAAWLGKGPIQAFLREKLDSGQIRVSFQGGSMWKVDAPSNVTDTRAARKVWGTQEFHALKLAEAILTNGKIRVTYRGDDGKTYLDEDATAAAQAKADEMREEFQDWLWATQERTEQIKKRYNDLHNNLALRSYDGQRRTMPGLAEWFKPHAHQHAAVARMVSEPAVLLAHEVGAGKTAEMAMGVMELRRLGLVNKAAIVVPNHMLNQFRDEFAELYPESATNGRILAASSDDLQGRKRREFIARVATGDYDAVILTQNAFESIPMRPEVQLDYIKREKEALEKSLERQQLEDQAANPGKRTDSRMVKEIRNRLKKLEAKVTAKLEAQKDMAGLYFEDTGIDYVVVDEAHHYKNLSTNSTLPGAAIEGSNRASDLDMKLEYLRKTTKSGRVVTFATATPISNSITEAHTMLRYLRPDLLEKAKIRNFDDFASTYGKVVNGTELAADGSGFREVSRFAAFRNMPELLRIWRTVADVKNSDDLAEYLDTPDVAGGKAVTISVEPTDGLLAYMDQIAARARAVKSGDVDPKVDNMLKINSDGRKVSLDPRMVGIDEQGAKLPAAADNIARIYTDTKDAVYPTSKNNPAPHTTTGGLQIVFLDMGTPAAPGKSKKKGNAEGAADMEELGQTKFPAYQEMKELLIERGVPAEKIRFIHEAKNDAEKAQLFADARNGKISVLLGSTTKMGVGTNVQLRATALHHLDCPWRPADLEQRNGRIIRQGNANPEVAIFQYVTEGSFDGFAWQTVARKAKFIRQLMKGSLTERTVEDIPDGVFNAEQVTAISTGNPYLLEQANVKVALGALTRKLKGHLRTIDGYKSTIYAAERLRTYTDELVAQLRDVNRRKKNTRGDDFNATIGTTDFTNREEAAKAFSAAAKAVLRQGIQNQYRPGGHPEVVLGKVGNIEITAQYRTGWDNHGRVHLVDVRIPDVPQSLHTYDEKYLDQETTLPIARIEDKLADIDKRIVAAESYLRQEERSAATARERVDRPFEQAADLEVAERRSKLIAAVIREQGRDVSGEDAAKAKRDRMEALEHQLREARIAAGESAGDVDDPAEAQDTDLLPRTPAPPSIGTDEKGRPRITWPDAEARKAAKERKKKEKQQRAREERGETTLDAEEVRNDLDSLREESSEAAAASDADTPEQDEEQVPQPAEEPEAPAPAAAERQEQEAAPEGAGENETSEVQLDATEVRSELDSLRPDSGETSDDDAPDEEEAPETAPDSEETADDASENGETSGAPSTDPAGPSEREADSAETVEENADAPGERGAATPAPGAQPAQSDESEGDRSAAAASDPESDGSDAEEKPTPERNAGGSTSGNEQTEDQDEVAQRRAARAGTSSGSSRSSTSPRAPRAAGEQDRGTVAARPEPQQQPAPADLTNDQLAESIDALEDQLTPLTDSTNPLDLAMRRRLEHRQWELENEERRRWTREPQRDDSGNLVEPSRNDVVSDRLAGYDLNDAEADGLVSRVENLPAAKDGAYSDEEWERISAEASAREDYPPTDEQNIIIEGAARRRLNMAVMALAGTGKSSTLKMLSHRMPDRNIVYLAFNRSVAAEAREAQTRGEYAKNMLASTANAYAARVADRRLNDRLPSNRAGGFKKLDAQQIADRMRWHNTVRAGNRDLTPGGAATVAERMIREWAKSADAEVGPQHVKAGTPAERRELFNAVKPLADRMWANLSDPEAGDSDRDLPMDFDYIVKQWALSGYKLDADVLFWDEAQDVNPVLEGVVRAALDQGVQVVAVGDSNQAIYGFRGASDALAKLPVDARATLTQSFRFGPAVADVGNRFLRLLGTRMRLKGFDRKDSRIGQLQPGEESMVIARTNAGVALAAVQALTAGRTVAVSGGVKALQEFVQAANALAAGEDTDHAELARFNGKAFDDIVEEVKADPDLQQLSSLFNLLEKHGDDIEALLSSGSRPAGTDLVGDRVWVRLDWNDPKANDLKRWLGDAKNNGVGKLLYDPATRRYFYEPGKREVPWKARGRSGVHKIDNRLSLEEAQQRIDVHLANLYPQDEGDEGKGRLVPDHEPHDVLVTTAHKAKGLESPRVRIADDFKGPEEKEGGSLDWDADSAPSDEALRVAYVAVTRATEVLDPGSLGWVFRAVRDDDPTQPPKGEYRRDFEPADLKVGDQVDFLEEDGTPNIGVISEIDGSQVTVRSTSDEPGLAGKRQEIGAVQVQRRNGEGRPLLPVASDAELDDAIGEGRYDSQGSVRLDAEGVRTDLANLGRADNNSQESSEPESDPETSQTDVVEPEAAQEAIDASESVSPWHINMGDYIRVETQNTAGNPVVREGYLLDVAKQVTAHRSKEKIKAWRLYLGQEGDQPSRQNVVTIPREQNVERLAPPVPETREEEEHTNTLGWKGPDETREKVGQHDGKDVEVGELHVTGSDARRAVYLGGERIGRLDSGNGGWRAHHDKHGAIGNRWFVGDTDFWKSGSYEPADPTRDAALAVARSHENGEERSNAYFHSGRAVSQHDAEQIVAAHLDPRLRPRWWISDTKRGRADVYVDKNLAGEIAGGSDRWQVVGGNGKPDGTVYPSKETAAQALAEASPLLAIKPSPRFSSPDYPSTLKDADLNNWIAASKKWLAEEAPQLPDNASTPTWVRNNLSELEGEREKRDADGGSERDQGRQPSPTSAEEASTEGDVIDAGQGRRNDYVRLETETSWGEPQVREGYLLGTPRRGTGHLQNAENFDAWVLHIGDGPNQTPTRGNEVKIRTDQKIQRLATPAAPELGHVDINSAKLGEYIRVTLPDAEGNAATHEGYVSYLSPNRTGFRGDAPIKSWSIRLKDSPHDEGVYEDTLIVPAGHDVERMQAPGPVPELEIPDLPGIDLSEYTRADDKDVQRYRDWAGVWANPTPDGPRNALLDRVTNMPGPAYKPLRPEEADRWIGTAGDAFPLDQFDENTRHLLAAHEGEQRDFLARQAAAMRETTQQIAGDFRVESRKSMVAHIATRDGMANATEELNARWTVDMDRIHQVVPEQVTAAMRDGDRSGLTEQQIKDFLTGVAGGDDSDQVANGLSGAFPELRRSLLSARVDVLSYYAGFRAWTGQDDDRSFSGYHHFNTRIQALGGQTVPAGDPRTGAGPLIIGEAELPAGMRWARLQTLRPGSIYRQVSGRRRDGGTFDGLSHPYIVINTHADGFEGRLRTTSVTSGGSSETPGDWVVELTAPEARLRRRAQAAARDRNLKRDLERDEQEWEATQSQSRRPQGDAVDIAALKVGERVRVRGSNEFMGGMYVREGDLAEPPKRAQMWRNGEQVDGWRLRFPGNRGLNEYAYVADGGDDEWAERIERQDSASNDTGPETSDADAPERPAEANGEEGSEGDEDEDSGRRDRDDRRSDRNGPDETSGGNNGDGGGDAPDPEGDADDDDDRDEEEADTDERRDRRRRRDRDRDRNGGGRDGGAPNGGRPRIPGRDRDRDKGRDGRDRDRSGNADTPALDGLKDRYRSGDAPTPSGADPQEHAAYLGRLANNDTLALSPGGRLITWSDDDGRTWQFGHAVSGTHLADWEADGEQIGGRDGARRLAGEYENLRSDDGSLIGWEAPELDLEALRTWMDAEGNPLGLAIEETRQNVIRTRPTDFTGQREQQSRAVAPGNADDRSDSEPAGDGQREGADGTQPGRDGEGAARGAADASQSRYAVNANHYRDAEKQRAGFVDGRRIPTANELRQYEAGEDRIISEEGERALFGSPEEMRALASEGMAPGPVLPNEGAGQVWRNGRLIGSLTAPHTVSNSPNPTEVWWSNTPFGESPHFSTREAALAHLVLRDIERGEPDLGIVHPDLANTLANVDVGLAFPKDFRGLETLTDNPGDLERYEALRKLVAALGRGVVPSGNVADDLAQLYDELRWLDATHYKHQPANLKDKYILGPGWFADQISRYLDVLRPEDPRAMHHKALKNRAARQVLGELETPDWQDTAERVSAGDLREGDVVFLEGRITGLYPGATGRRLGYVVGEPKKVKFTADKVRYKGYRIAVAKDPFQDSQHTVEGQTFLIPDSQGPILRLARAEDVHFPLDQHQYGRQVGETPSTQTGGADRGAAPSSTPSAPDTGATPARGSATGGDSTGAPSASAPTRNTTATGENGSTRTRQPANSTPAAPNNGGADTDRTRREETEIGPATAAEPRTAPEAVGGRPAEWVQVSTLQTGDLVRIDGETRAKGTARTLSGYVVAEGPKQLPIVRNGRSREMYRVLIADEPNAPTGTPVWVPLDAAAARATRDEADQFQGSPQTGADSDVLTGRIAGRVPTDANGNGLFPGSLVTDDDGNEGVITGASANSVRVQFGDDRTDDDHAPTSLNVTDGGAARPAGWTPDGHLVDEGNVVGDRDGNFLGTVESTSGDTASVATLSGVQDEPIAQLRVIGDTANDQGTNKVDAVQPTPAKDVKEGDVLVRPTPSGPTTARVTRREENGDQSHFDLEDTTTGEPSELSVTSDTTMQRAVDADGNPPELGPEDAPNDSGEIVVREPAPAVTPVTGQTVDPQLTPEEREAITGRGPVPTGSPEAQEGAARIANDQPVTPAQASALAEELREGADSSTPEGRAAQRAADRLDAAAGNEPVAGQPEPGTIGSVGAGDTIGLPDEFAPDTVTTYRVVQVQEAPGGVRVLTVEDGDGMRFERTFASSAPLHQLPEPEAPAAADEEPRDPNPAPDADKIRSDYADAVVRAVIGNAIDGTTTPGSIHQLRQQIAEQLTPEALRTAMRRARNGALSAITDAGIEGGERDDLVQSLRKKAATARTDAVRAALRTVNDFEPLDGESDEEMARRAAELLRLIPEALATPPARSEDDSTDAEVNNAVTQHADDAVGEALQAATSGELLTPERRNAIVQRLAAQMDATRNDTAQRIAERLPAARRPGIMPHIVAGLAAIARTIVAIVVAFLKGLAKAWQRSREGLRRMRERLVRFRRGLAQRIRSWPDTRRLRRLAAARSLPQHGDGMPLGDRVAHWARLLPAPGRFGQVSRRARWYRPASRSSLAAGALPEVQDGVRWTMDRAVDGGPGPQALRHLAALRAAGQDVDADVVARLTAAAPELGDDPHGTVRHAAAFADTAERRLRNLAAAAAGGAPDADLEITAARVEAQAARREADRLRQAYAAALPAAVRETLGEIREMGPGTTATLVTTPDSDPAAVRALTGIAQFVPRDWLSPTETRFIGARSGAAGGYDAGSRIATVADLGDEGRRTAAHALLAHLQQHYPDLLAAQETFQFTRTHSGRVGARRRTSLDRLLARLFRNDTGHDENGDLVPLGLATLFSGDWYEDDDLRAFLLGLLATR